MKLKKNYNYTFNFIKSLNCYKIGFNTAYSRKS